jgi:hypothetical protein
MDKLKEMLLMDPCYEQHIVSIKDIYEEDLFSILVPAIYEGFQSLYKRADQIERKFIIASKRNPDIENPGILIIFQTLIKDIPNLNTHKIRAETDRIKSSTKSADIFDDLVKAVCKSNIVLLTYNIDHKRKTLLQTKYHESIVIHDFIHSCYIQCAKKVYIQPELFYHKQEAIVINQNKRTCYALIRDSVKTAIRLMLPMKDILLEYITHKYEQKDRVVYNPYTQQNVGTLPLGLVPNLGGNVQFNRMLGENANTQNVPSLLMQEEFVDVNQMIDRDTGVNANTNTNNDGDSLLEDNYDPNDPNYIINSENENSFVENGFDKSKAYDKNLPNITENAIKNYSILLSENSSPKGGNRNKDNASFDGSADGSVDGEFTNVNSNTGIGSTNNQGQNKSFQSKEQIKESDKSDASVASAAKYGIKTVDISTAITKKTKPYFDEAIPEIKKRVLEYKNTKKQPINDKDNIQITRTSGANMDKNIEKNTKNLVDNILKT